MSDALRDQLSLLPTYVSAHLVLTLTAIACGLAITIPCAILVLRVPMLKGPTLAVASATQTIPSLALLALMVPLLGSIGFQPAVIALTLYSVLPMLRNTVTGIEDVEPSLLEAGRGLGMTPGQLLRDVQLPLAMPVIVAGIRTALVWVVGIATLSSLVGATSLGDPIISGLQLQNGTAVLTGCVAAMLLALLLDGLVRLIQQAAARRSVPLFIASSLAIVVLLGIGLAPSVLSGRSSSGGPRITIGAKTFTEQYILTQAMADLLEDAGAEPRVLRSLGSTVVFDALVLGEIDCYVDYSGTIWANHLKRDDVRDAQTVIERVTSWLETTHGITCLGPLGFENAYAIAMPRADAERLEVDSIDDLTRYAPTLTIGGDYEFFGRPEWARVRDTYALDVERTLGMDGTLMYEAVATNDIDVIAAFSTDGRIAANDLVVLDDPRGALPPYDALLLVNARIAGDDALRGALERLVGSISDAQMRDANMAVDVDGKAVSSAARMLLNALPADRYGRTASP